MKKILVPGLALLSIFLGLVICALIGANNVHSLSFDPALFPLILGILIFAFVMVILVCIVLAISR